ncbi:hypothetical protein [Streptococcus suis]|nr:hypothetical protein [Streptococcus suis]
MNIKNLHKAGSILIYPGSDDFFIGNGIRNEAAVAGSLVLNLGL